ncbi:MAG: phage tail tape measure protein [Planctomycetota bacterium]
MAARDIRAGGAFVEFSLEKSALLKGLRSVESELKRFGQAATQIGSQLAALGSAITGPFVASAKVFADFGDSLDKAASRTGVSVEALSELGFAAEQSGANFAELENGIRRLQRSIIDLGRGLSTQRAAFDALGLSFADLEKRTPEDQLTAVADALAAIPDPTKRAATAMQVLGRAGQRLLPLFADGAAGMQRLRTQARELGFTINRTATREAAALTDTINILKTSVQRVAFALGEAVSPEIRRFAESATGASAALREAVAENNDLVKANLKLGATLTALGGAILGVGVGARGLSFALGGLRLALNPAVLIPAGLVAGLAGIIGYFNDGEVAGVDFGGAVLGLAQNLRLLDKVASETDRALTLEDANAALKRATEEAVAAADRLKAAQGTEAEVKARREAVDALRAQIAAMNELRKIEGRLGIGLNDPDVIPRQGALPVFAGSIRDRTIRKLENQLAEEEALLNKVTEAPSVAKVTSSPLSQFADRIGETLRKAAAAYVVARDEFDFELGQFLADGQDAQIQAIERAAELLKRQAEKLGLLSEDLTREINAAVGRQVEAITGGGNKALQDEIDRLRVELSTTGIDRERALLKLRERQRIRDAKQNGEDVDKIRELFRLRNIQLERQFMDLNARRNATRGVLNSGAIQALSSVGKITKGDQAIVRAIDRQTRKIDDTNRLLGDGGVVTV